MSVITTRPDIEPARGLDAGVEHRQASQRFHGLPGVTSHQTRRARAAQRTRDERMPSAVD